MNIQNSIRKLFTGLFLCSLFGCSGGYNSVEIELGRGNGTSLEKKSDVEGSARENSYQIGLSWNRKILDDTSKVAGQIFQLYRNGMGAVGTGTYLGEIGGRHLVMTAAHTYNQLSSCKEEVSFIAKSEEFDLYFSCSGWSYKLYENDILFFEIESFDEGAFEKLNPVSFSSRELIKGEPLQMITIERQMPGFNFNWFVDDSSECILLEDHGRYFKDPDDVILSEELNRLTSWSLPIGCDGQRGDSGAPVFDKDLGLAGVLWTGKYPKTDVSNSLKSLTADSVWSNFNYMVPMSTVDAEISSILEKRPEITFDTVKVLTSLRDKIRNKAD